MEKCGGELGAHPSPGSTPNFAILLKWQPELLRRPLLLRPASARLAPMRPDEPHDDETDFQRQREHDHLPKINCDTSE
jgi:hypothetical protein